MRRFVTWWGGPGGIEACPWDYYFLQCFDTVGWVIWPVKTVPEMTYNVFSGTLNPAQSQSQSPNNVTRRSNPQKYRPLAEPRHLSHKAWISAVLFELGVGRRTSDRTEQDRKKVKKGYISPILGAHRSDLHHKLCSRWTTRRNYVCQVSKRNLKGLPFYKGRIFHFPIDFEWALQQCSAVLSLQLLF